MAGPTGADGQIGFKSETTPGTVVTVDKFLPFISEGIKNDITYMDTKTISARRVLRLTKRGTNQIGGPIQTELANATLATLLRHMFGTINTTGAGPYVHTASPGSFVGQSLTIQVGRPATTGTVHPFTYAGCKIAEWGLKCATGEIATLDLSVVAMSEVVTTPALAVASYDSAWSPFTFVEGAVSVAGSSVASVKSFELAGKNMVAHRFRVGSGNSLQPLEEGLREYSGTIVTDFDALTHYALFTSNTNAAVVLTFTNGAAILEITMNVQFVGETPTVGGFELLEQPLPFRAISTTSDAAAITAVLTNTDVSAV